MAKLEFLANMNISPLTVEQLKKNGWNVVRISEVMDRGSKDIDILIYAQKRNKVVITQDLDFSAILALSGYWGFGVRLWIFGFSIIHKKVGPS